MYVIGTALFDECFLLYVISARYCFFYKFIDIQIFIATAMLMRSLKQMFWKKSVFYPRHLYKNKHFLKSFILMFFFILWVFHILLYERNLLTPNLSGGMFYKGYLWSNLYDAIFSCTNCFDKVRAKSQCTWHLYKQGLYKVIKFTTFSSNSTQNKQKTQKSQKHEKLDLQKIE